MGDDVISVVREAAELFRSYERHHRSKISAPDRGDLLDIRDKRNASFEEKAQRNAKMAAKLEAALDRLSPNLEGEK